MIIVGLGNPGPEFTGTRHNVGFFVVDALAENLGLEWRSVRDVMVAKDDTTTLIKPWTYMNRSGAALKDYFSYTNIFADPAALHAQLLVIHDDLDFPIGTYKLQRDRSSAGHNGVQSIIDAFSTKDFSRFRIGISPEGENIVPGDEFVLQRFSAPDRDSINRITGEILQKLLGNKNPPQR